MSTFRYRLVGVSASDLDAVIESGSGSTAALLARPPWTQVTLVDNSREPDLDEFMSGLGYVPDTTGPVVVVTVNHTIGTESIVLADATGGPIQVDIPLTTNRLGDELVVMKVDASTNAVTVTRSGADTIEGLATQVLAMQGESLRLLADEVTTNWHITASRRASDAAYDPTGTGLVSTTVQDALTEIANLFGAGDLQSAYVNGNTITTSAGDGNVIVAGTELLRVTAAGGLDLDTILDADVTTFDVQMTGLNGFSLDGTAASNVSVAAGVLTLSTTTSGNINVSAAGAVTVDAGNEAAATGNDILVNAGDGGGANPGGGVLINGGDSGTGATGDGGAIAISSGNAASTDGNGGELFLVTGNSTGVGNSGDLTITIGSVGGTGLHGVVGVVSPAPSTQPVVRLSTTGAGGNIAEFFVGSGSPNGTISGLAGSLFLRDTGTSGQAWLNTSTGSGTTWTMLATGGAGTQDLLTTLGIGNITGGTDIILTSGDEVQGQSGVSLAGAVVLRGATASSGTAAGGAVTVVGGNAVTTGAGGNITLTPGTGAGGGAAGIAQVNGPKHYANSTTDPTSPAPATGDRYYNTTLEMEMRYDGTRAKWLSVDSDTISGSDLGTLTSGTYLEVGSLRMTSTYGYTAHFNGTVVSLGYTRGDSDAASWEVTTGGTTIATVATSATSGQSTSLNANFTQGDILGIRNGGANSMTDTIVWVRVKWRA